MAIKVKHLSYVYNKGTPFENKALDNINIEIQEGETVFIVGHTGSGKSTFIQHLNGLIKVQSGELSVSDVDLNVKKPDYKKVRSVVGMVFQYPEYQLFADTVFDDVAFGPRNMKLSEEEVYSRAKNAIQEVGLNFKEFAGKSPFELSGGEKRRVAIAGVIAMQPKILVLDEPTAGLDPVGKNEILGLIENIKKTITPTIIIVNHDMNEVAEHATKVIVFNEGKITRYLPPLELFKEEDYLLSIGLELPSMTVFTKELRKKGIDIGNCLTVQDAFDRIVNYISMNNVNGKEND